MGLSNIISWLPSLLLVSCEPLVESHDDSGIDIGCSSFTDVLQVFIWIGWNG